MTGTSGAEPEPDGQVFESIFRVRFHEIDALGHVNNAAYLNYLEQAAIDHAQSLGLGLERLRGLGGVFVAHHHEITFLQPSFAGDVPRIVTWLTDPRGARVDRHYRVYRDTTRGISAALAGRAIAASNAGLDEDLVTRARTEWVFANERGQPRGIPKEVIDVFRLGMPDSSIPKGAE